MRTYSFGTETVPTALAGDLLVGIVHDGKNYRIMLARLKNGEISETRFLAGENDWEGHSALDLGDGYLIGGSVEGTATPDGGEGWKAYLARLDGNLNVLWELKLDVRSNGAVHSILPAGDGIIIADETGRPGNRGFFMGKVSPEGELLWLRDFGSWEDGVFTALLPSGSGLKLIGSVKDGRWEVRAFDFDENGELRGEEALAEGIALTACLWNGELVLAGYRGRTSGSGLASAMLSSEREARPHCCSPVIGSSLAASSKGTRSSLKSPAERSQRSGSSGRTAGSKCWPRIWRLGLRGERWLSLGFPFNPHNSRVDCNQHGNADNYAPQEPRG